MQLSVIATCERTGKLGIAMTGDCVGIGRYCEAIRPNVGAVIVQGRFHPALTHLGLELLAQGLSADDTLAEILRNDADGAHRQIAVLGFDSRSAVHTGAEVAGRTGHYLGNGMAILGGGLPDGAALEAMADRFAASAEQGLDERMMAMLEVGCDAAGLERRGVQMSAAVITYGEKAPVELFVRNDLSPQAITDLRAVFDEYKTLEPLYAMRTSNPAAAPTPAQIEAATKAAAAARLKEKT